MNKYRLKLFVEFIFALSLAKQLMIEIKFKKLKIKCMYALKNKVQLIGNLGNNPEIRTTESGKKLARFSVATNETYRSAKGEKMTETQWHNLFAWGKIADIAEQFLSKGSEIAIEGKLVNRNYTDKDGNKRYVTEIQVNEILLLGDKKVAKA
jgi:single-strand DNA-binding protein